MQTSVERSPGSSTAAEPRQPASSIATEQHLSASFTASELRLPAERSQLSAARRYVRNAADSFGLSAAGAYDFVYAVNEAVTNAIRHGRPDAQGFIHLSIDADGDRLTFTVRDSGTFAAPLPDSVVRGEVVTRLSQVVTPLLQVATPLSDVDARAGLETPTPTTLAEHGRGFELMASLTDAVRLRAEPGSITVSLAKDRV